MKKPKAGNSPHKTGAVEGTKRKKPEQREAAEQEALFRWAEFVVGRYPELDLLHHIPNGGSRNAMEAANLKRQGVKAGVPDLFLPVARNGWHGLYIEMKAGSNKTTAMQDRWIDALRKQGYLVAVCYDWGTAVKVLTHYLDPKSEARDQENEEA